MTFHYNYRNDASDIWKLSMIQVYSSLIGVCNIIFTFAMIFVTAALWNKFGIGIQLIMLLACSLFIIIQPISVWSKAKKRAQQIKDDTDLLFDDKGVHVTVVDKHENIPWKKIKKISKMPGFVIVYSGSVHGYIIPNRVLGKERKKFCEYVTGKIN